MLNWAKLKIVGYFNVTLLRYLFLVILLNTFNCAVFLLSLFYALDMIYFTSFVMMDQIFLGSVCALCGGNCRGINAQVFTYCNADPDPASEKSSMWIRIHCHTGHSRGLRWYRYLAYLPAIGTFPSHISVFSSVFRVWSESGAFLVGSGGRRCYLFVLSANLSHRVSDDCWNFVQLPVKVSHIGLCDI